MTKVAVVRVEDADAVVVLVGDEGRCCRRLLSAMPRGEPQLTFTVPVRREFVEILIVHADHADAGEDGAPRLRTKMRPVGALRDVDRVGEAAPYRSVVHNADSLDVVDVQRLCGGSGHVICPHQWSARLTWMRGTEADGDGQDAYFFILSFPQIGNVLYAIPVVSVPCTRSVFDNLYELVFGGGCD